MLNVTKVGCYFIIGVWILWLLKHIPLMVKNNVSKITMERLAFIRSLGHVGMNYMCFAVMCFTVLFYVYSYHRPSACIAIYVTMLYVCFSSPFHC